MNISRYFFLFLGMNQCKLLSCSLGEECEIDKQGITNCVCSHTCEPMVRPVCASNGNSYDNLCEMQKSGCEERQDLRAKYFGICGNYLINCLYNDHIHMLSTYAFRFQWPVQQKDLQPPFDLCREW